MSCDLTQEQVDSATGQNIPVNPATANETSGCNWINRTTNSFVEVDINTLPAGFKIPSTAPAFPGVGRSNAYYDASNDPEMVGQCFNENCQFTASVFTNTDELMISAYLNPPSADPKGVAKALLVAAVQNSQ